MQHRALSEGEFASFQRFIFDSAGITMSGSKKALVGGRQVRVHVYRAAGGASRFASLEDPAACEALLADLMDVAPGGEASRLGDGVNQVLKEFRGGSLNAVVGFTDGVTTAGEELSAAGRAAGPGGRHRP